MEGLKIAGVVLLVLSAAEIPLWQYLLARQRGPQKNTLALAFYGSSVLTAAVGLGLLVFG
jgi:hypothetical protein